MLNAIGELHELLGNAGFLKGDEYTEKFLLDERGLYSGRALAVVQPGTTEELAALVRICHCNGIGMVPQGGNTGYCGGATPDAAGGQVLINLSRLNRIREIDRHDLTLSADAGVVLADAQAAAAEQNLLLPLSMGSEGSCQLGGNLSTNAGGLAVLRYGTARDLVAGLEVVLPDGRVLSDLDGLRKDNTGYDLKQLFLGAEGTLGIISGVMLRLVPKPRAFVTAWLGVRDIGDVLESLVALRADFGDCVTSVEYVANEALSLLLRNFPEFSNPLGGHVGDFALIEFSLFDNSTERTSAIEAALGQLAERGVIGDAVVAHSETQRQALWRLRESIPAAEKRAGGSIKHDVSVRLGQLRDFVVECSEALTLRFPGVRLSIYGHVGDGNVHLNVLGPPAAEPLTFRRDYGERVSELVHEMAHRRHGSFSAEHGVGQLKRELLRATKDPVAYELMLRLKKTLDPKGLMNPGKVLIDPR